MLQLQLSSTTALLLLAWVVLLCALLAIAKAERMPASPDELNWHVNWNWLKPVPSDLQILMKKALGRAGSLREVLASCAATYDDRFSELIKLIQKR